MTVSKILLADYDLEYGTAIARAITDLSKEYEVTVIDELMNNLKTDLSEFDIVLIGSSHNMCVEIIRNKIKTSSAIVVLSDYNVEDLEKQSENEDNHIFYIYKYCRVDQMISDLNFLIGFTSGKRYLARKNIEPDLIGFYSAGSGAGKSVIALGTARELSRYHDKKVIYICFEDLPVTELFLRNNSVNRNIGDYLYYLLEKKNECLCSHPEGFTVSDEYGVETFLPTNGRNDLNHLNCNELISFLKMISESSRYDYIVLDLRSDLSDETLFLFHLCSKIFLLQNDSLTSKFRNTKLLRYLSRLGRPDLKGRIILVANKCSCIESESVYCNDSQELIKKIIQIERDEESFRCLPNFIDMDISHSFGIGIKIIAEELVTRA